MPTSEEVQRAIDDLSMGMKYWCKGEHYTPCPPSVRIAITALQAYKSGLDRCDGCPASGVCDNNPEPVDGCEHCEQRFKEWGEQDADK